MQAQFKKFIGGITGATEAQKAFMLTNLFSYAVSDVKIDKNGIVTCETVTDFCNVETLTLNKQEQSAWDLFNDFDSPKNASNVIMSLIESKTFINGESFKMQGKITCKSELPKHITFSIFLGLLSDEQKTAFFSIADEWVVRQHLDENSFEFFFINGSNGLTLKAGDYVWGYDAAMGRQYPTRVLQASPNGLVTVLDVSGFFTLAKSAKPRVADKKELPADVVATLDTNYEKQVESMELYKLGRIEKAIKLAERNAEVAKKELAKKEAKDKKAAELKKLTDAGIKIVTELKAMPLTTKDEIAAAVKKLNDSKVTKDQKAEVSGIIRAANVALKAKIEAAKIEAAKQAKSNASKQDASKPDASKPDASKPARPQAKPASPQQAKASKPDTKQAKASK